MAFDPFPYYKNKQSTAAAPTVYQSPRGMFNKLKSPVIQFRVANLYYYDFFILNKNK